MGKIIQKEGVFQGHDSQIMDLEELHRGKCNNLEKVTGEVLPLMGLRRKGKTLSESRRREC